MQGFSDYYALDNDVATHRITACNLAACGCVKMGRGFVIQGSKLIENLCMATSQVTLTITLEPHKLLY